MTARLIPLSPPRSQNKDAAQEQGVIRPLNIKACIRKCIDVMAECLVPWHKVGKKRGVEVAMIFLSEFSTKESDCLLSAAPERQGQCLCRELHLWGQEGSPLKIRGRKYKNKGIT